MSVEFKAISMNDTIGNIKHLTMYQEIGYANNSTKTVYIGTSNGDIYPIYPSYLPTYPTHSLQIYIRYTQGTRKFSQLKEVSDKGFTVNFCDIPIKEIEEKEYVYIDKLDICVCLDPSKIEQYHEKLRKNIEKVINNRVNSVINGVNSAPIKIFGNDGKGVIDTLWVAIGNIVSSVKINRDPILNTYCTLEIGSSSTKYFSYEVDLDKIRKGETIEIITDEEVIAIGPTEDRVRNWQYQRKIDGGTVYTKSQINTLIAESIRKYKNEVEDLKFDNAKLSSELVRVKEELKHYRELYNSVISDKSKEETEKLKQEQERLKQTFEKEKQEWEREKREYEREKIKSDIEAANNKYRRDTIDQIIKTVGVLAGTVVTLGTIYYKLKSE